jgi:hypothetical protein
MMRERGLAVHAYDTVAGHVGISAGPHDVADGASGERPTGEHGHEPVRRDASSRDAVYDLVDEARPLVVDALARCRHHGPSSCQSDAKAILRR